MHHKLDIHPIPENVLYINELSMVTEQVYETTKEVEQAFTGKTVSNGGILPDDNIRIYVPMDLNMNEIMFRVYRLYSVLGYPTERNESEFSTKMEQIVSQLEYMTRCGLYGIWNMPYKKVIPWYDIASKGLLLRGN